jgi:hypothetical protein
LPCKGIRFSRLDPPAGPRAVLKDQPDAILIWKFRLGEPPPDRGGQPPALVGIERLFKGLIVGYGEKLGRREKNILATE